MILLESGPAKVDRTYWLVFGILFLGVSAYFVYDGAYGYYNKNREQAEQKLPSYTSLSAAGLGKKPTEKDFNELVLALKDRPLWRGADVLHAKLGEPLPPKKEPGTASENVDRFASVYGMAIVPYEGNGKVDGPKVQWVSWGKSEDDIREQFYWAVIPFVGALYFFFRCYRAGTLRAVIDEEGLTYGGLRIAFADMLSLRDYNKKGWVDLYYRDGGKEKRLRIDNQKIAKFDEIAELICQKKGFENPIQAAQREEPAPEPEEAPDETKTS